MLRCYVIAGLSVMLSHPAKVMANATSGIGTNVTEAGACDLAKRDAIGKAEQEANYRDVRSKVSDCTCSKNIVGMYECTVTVSWERH